MIEKAVDVNDIAPIAPRRSEWRRFRRVFLSRKLVMIGMVILLFLVFIAIFAPWLAPFPPNIPVLEDALQNPNSAHWLGTDALGRDLLSRIMWGARTSLGIGLVVVALASVIGVILGLLAGYYGGWINAVIMRIIDALMSFPMIILALVIAALLGNGIKNVVIALSIAMMPSYARVMCAQVLSIKENDYITASRSLGSSNPRIMFSHILHNCLPPLIVMITMMLGSVILAEAGLSYLGIGISPPTPSWGSMINDGQQYLLDIPIISFAPGVALMFTIFAFNMIGDGLRDALDPSLRGTL